MNELEKAIETIQKSVIYMPRLTGKSSLLKAMDTIFDRLDNILRNDGWHPMTEPQVCGTAGRIQYLCIQTYYSQEQRKKVSEYCTIDSKKTGMMFVNSCYSPIAHRPVNLPSWAEVGK